MTRATYTPPPSEEPPGDVHAGLVHVLPVPPGARFLPTPGTGSPVDVVGLLLYDVYEDEPAAKEHTRSTWLEAVDITGHVWLVTGPGTGTTGQGSLSWPPSYSQLTGLT